MTQLESVKQHRSDLIKEYNEGDYNQSSPIFKAILTAENTIYVLQNEHQKSLRCYR